MASADSIALRAKREESRSQDVVLTENKIFVKTLKGEVVLDAHDKTHGESVSTTDIISILNSKNG